MGEAWLASNAAGCTAAARDHMHGPDWYIWMDVAGVLCFATQQPHMQRMNHSAFSSHITFLLLLHMSKQVPALPPLVALLFSVAT